MSENLGKRTTRGVAWSSLESFGGAALTVATTMILARLVTPEDYGLVAVLQIFVAVGLLLVESGFSTALIRLKTRTKRHESTVLAFNLAIALAIYLVIFFCSPLIASFYGNPRLTAISRVLALVMPLNALCVVQHSRLTATMRFASLFVATGIAALVSSLAAIGLALTGAGVWSLVAQQLIMWGLRAFILWIILRDAPILPRFYLAELKELFSFGWKLLVSSMISKISSGLYSMAIGRIFTVTEAGLFSKSSTLASFPAENGTSTIQRVSFPALCKLAADPKRLADATRKIITMSSWAIFPVMTTLAALAPQCIKVVLGDQWTQAAPYFAVICLAYSLYPFHSINLNILNVFGRSDLFLRLEIIKAILSLSLMIAGLYLGGIMGICVAFFLSSYICIFVNGYYSRKYSGIGIFDQLCILFPIIILSLISAAAAFCVASQIVSPLLSLSAGIATASAVYIAVSLLFFPKYKSLLYFVISHFKQK